MEKFMSLSLYFHTVKYLKLSQVFNRVTRRFFHPKNNSLLLSIDSSADCWVSFGLYEPKLLTQNTVKFLNETGEITSPLDWNHHNKSKLWLYNLHYFDDLCSFDSSARHELQSYWISKWICENPLSEGGNGWEPYVLSLRIVNWIKAFLGGLNPEDEMLSSLSLQSDILSQCLEKHLLGNHYFSNLKALLFAGCYFEGNYAAKWLEVGLEGYRKEIREQILTDGGNFELSPMYHAIMLTDLLDLYNLFLNFPLKIPKDVVEVTKKSILIMFDWLNAMSLGDDKISFFNDSAFGIAPSNDVLRRYAAALGIIVNEQNVLDSKLNVFDLDASGYVSIRSNELCLIADLSSVGPSYIPGHAHADSLSFEFSLDFHRIFVNSGISLYGVCVERLRQRGTSAHNTVLVDNKNSSEIWSGFRVARRASIRDRFVEETLDKEKVRFGGAHNGYLKQGINCLHRRTWELSAKTCVIEDFIKGTYKSAISYLHLHPSVEVFAFDVSHCVLKVSSYKIYIDIIGAMLHVEESSWHPEFGLTQPSKRLCLSFTESRVIYNIHWECL